MPTEKDLFSEEQQMVTMSFGEHIEDLRRCLILALLGLFVGVVVTFLPPLELGRRVTLMMQEPAQQSLDEFYRNRAVARSGDAQKVEARTEPIAVYVAGKDFDAALRRLYPSLPEPDPAALEQSLAVPLQFEKAGMIRINSTVVEPRSALVSLGPLETFMIYFMVCLVTGLVISSPWVFYQIWSFIAAGLYRHERHYVQKFFPFSIGLFLGGVALCFFIVLPVTLDFLLQFNIWLGIEPTLRISEWMGFATMMPLIFGVCFQTPLVMLFLASLGIVTAEQFRSKRRYAILIMVVIAAAITPTQDPFSLSLLAVPMIALYELGIIMIGRTGRKAASPAALG